MLKLVTTLLLSCAVCQGARAPVIGGVYGASNNGGLPVKIPAKEKILKQEVCNTEVCQEAAASLADAMDITADPCEDFYQFACGGWMAKNTIPEGKSKWGRFYELRDKVDQDLHEIVEMEEPGAATAVANLRLMYQGCMDIDAIEAAGLSMLSGAMENGQGGGWPTLLQDDFEQGSLNLGLLLGGARRSLGADYLLSMWVYMDDLDTSKNTIYIDQPDLGLPLAMYSDEESYATYIKAYKQYMVDVATILSAEYGSSATEEQIVADVEQVFNFEKMVASLKNKCIEKGLIDFDWDTYFSSIFGDLNIDITDEERIIVVQPDYFAAVGALDVSEEVVLNYLWSRATTRIASELNQAMRDAAFRYSSVMTGVATAPERWQTCTAKATGAWGFAAAHEYIMRYFDSEAKAETEMMVEDLRSAFKELVSETEWMDGETQKAAMMKADQMLQLMAYPEWLTHEQDLDQYYEGSQPAYPDAHFNNTAAQWYWSIGKDLSDLRKEPERDVWLMHPAIVNAWYSPNHNTITFPAGILQPPFFKAGVPRYLNYGAMGMVIGHEITHGFDDQGRQYDGTGNLSPWWSEETLEGFVDRARCFIEQYGNYTVPELEQILGEDAHLNGKMTQGENIADNGGIHESFRAYLKSLEDGEPEPALPGLEQFTPKQMFFVSNAQVWCELQTQESLLGQVLGDPHSPGKFRVLGPLGNSQDFQREFSCPDNSAMVRPQKCKLW